MQCLGHLGQEKRTIFIVLGMLVLGGMAKAKPIVQCSQRQKTCVLQEAIAAHAQNLAPELDWTFIFVTGDLSWKLTRSANRACGPSVFTNLEQRGDILGTGKKGVWGWSRSC